MFVGTSCGAATVGALRVAAALKPEQNVVVILPDTGERYLSTDLFDTRAADGRVGAEEGVEQAA